MTCCAAGWTQAGDLAAAETLIQRHRDWALRFVQVRLGDAAAAEDVVQNALIKVLQRGSTYDWNSTGPSAIGLAVSCLTPWSTISGANDVGDRPRRRPAW